MTVSVLRCLAKSRLCQPAVRRCIGSASAPTAQPSNPESPEAMSWFLSAAVCVERIPTLVPELSPIQKDALAVLRQIEMEKSLKSIHELRHEADVDRARRRNEGDETVQAGIRTAMDDDDGWKKEFESFVPTPRITADDQGNDLRSTRRLMDRPLHLVVQRKIGQDLHWDLPSAINKSGETMRQTAERALEAHCGSQLGVRVLGNAPWAFYKFSYSRRIRESTGKRGEKVFIYKSLFEGGVITVNPDVCSDFKWLLRDDLWDVLDGPTRSSLFQVLYDEE